MVVRYEAGGERLECTCHRETMQIISAGICLTDHETGEEGDSYFTLESIAGVVLQAQRENRLAIYRRG
jgi:hypothetical protein